MILKIKFRPESLKIKLITILNEYKTTYIANLIIIIPNPTPNPKSKPRSTPRKITNKNVAIQTIPSSLDIFQ